MNRNNNPKITSDICNQLAVEYINYSLEKQQKSSINIGEYIDAQKDSVEENLQKLSSSLNDKNQKAKPVDICLSSSVIEAISDSLTLILSVLEQFVPSVVVAVT